ncbi:MAG: hypothetical protein ABGZ36_16125 [Actinomycetota bacterium]
MFAPTAGLDHLGLASVSQDRILPSLSPGINVLTVHPRYWSVYCWLLTEFWERDLPRTKAAWGRFLKPRERIFVAAVLSCDRHGVDIGQVGGKQALGLEIAEGASTFDPKGRYLKNAQGGYGIYASAIAQMGLTVLGATTSQFACDAPTEAGKALGFALRDAVDGSRYLAEHFDDDTTPVPATVVQEYGQLVCLCRLADGPDRGLLAEAFLHGGEELEAERRRASLQLVLDMSDTVDGEIDEDLFRTLVYHRQDDTQSSYVPTGPSITRTLRGWRLYQLREQQAWALNRWLRLLCDRRPAVGADGITADLDDLLAAGSVVDMDVLASALGIEDAPGLTGDSPLTELMDWVRINAQISTDLNAEWPWTAPASEWRVWDHLTDMDRKGEDVTAGIVVMLLASGARLWPREHRLTYADNWHLVQAGGLRRLSVERLLQDLRRLVADDATVGETARWLLEHYVVRQHHRVALAKLPDDTFRFRLDAGRVVFTDQTIPVVMNSARYHALATCAAELGWTSSLYDGQRTLTPEGRELAATGDASPVGAAL